MPRVYKKRNKKWRYMIREMREIQRKRAIFEHILRVFVVKEGVKRGGKCVFTTQKLKFYQ